MPITLAPVAIDPVLQGRRVLVLEDELLVALDLAERLAAAGAEVVGPAASLADADRLLAPAPRIDAAVLDIQLGEETVYPLADRLLAEGVPILFATGYSRRDLPERFGGVPLHEKPVRIDQVTRALREALAPDDAAGEPGPLARRFP